MINLNRAIFPISGPRENPKREDYATEVHLLRLHNRWETARRYERLWHRLGWAPDALNLMRTAA